MKIQCGEHEIEIVRSGKCVELIARTKGLRSFICNVNGIQGNLLTNEEMDSGNFEDSDVVFETEERAKEYEADAIKMCQEEPEQVAGCLDDDRAEGEWSKE